MPVSLRFDALRWRRWSALLIVISLALPERSCVNDGQVEIHYPLSGFDSVLSALPLVAFYTLPLLLAWAPRLRMAALLAGIATVAAGLYYIAYGATLFATQLLAGWYAYTGGATVYLLASLVQLWRAWRPGRVSSADDGA